MSNLPALLDRDVLFTPRDHHWTALESYLESGGSITLAAQASGLTRVSVISLTRRPWWKAQLEKRDFVPVTSEMLGEEIAKEAGSKALDRLGGENYLSNRDLIGLGRLGIELKKKPTEGVAISIGHIHQIDLRGYTPEQLAALSGDAIDAEFEVVD